MFAVVAIERSLEHDGLEPAAKRVGSQRRGGWRDVEVLHRQRGGIPERLRDPHRGPDRPFVLRIEEGADPGDRVTTLHVAQCTTCMWYT